MSFAHFSWLSAGSTERPMIFTFLRSNSGLTFAMWPSSVVQTGVKSFGCENSTAHESPIQSWKLIRPSVVSASKSGAVSPICSAIVPPSLSSRHSRLRGRYSSAGPGRSPALEVEARVFEVEVALDSAHDSVVDPAAASKLEDRATLGRQELVAEALVVARAGLDRAIALGTEAGAKALAAEVVEPAQSVGGVFQHPLLLEKLLEPCERCLRRVDAGLRLLLLGQPVVLEAESVDEAREGQTLEGERSQDDREGQEHDQIAVRKGRVRVGREGEGERGRKRHGAARARPGQDRRLPPGRGKGAFSGVSLEQAR